MAIIENIFMSILTFLRILVGKEDDVGDQNETSSSPDRPPAKVSSALLNLNHFTSSKTSHRASLCVGQLLCSCQRLELFSGR